MQTSAEIDALVAGETVPSAFLRTVREHPDQVALRWRDEAGEWRQLTFAEYAAEVARLVDAFHRLGVVPGQRVVLMMRNVPAFHIADVAATFCGATPISIYNSSAPDQVEYLVNHCEAVVAVLENRAFLDRFLPVRDRLEKLQHLVVLEGDDLPDGVISRDELLAGTTPVDLEVAAESCDRSQLATIIYTSGTTGNPKGVMLTHGNIMWTVECLRQVIGVDRAGLLGTRIVSYLPMAHIAERMSSHYQGIVMGYEITCCPEAGLLAEMLRETKPNLMFGVPRVWEKIHAGVQAALAADPEKKRQFDDAIATAIPIVEALDWDRADDEQKATYEFLDAVAFAPIRQLLGLDELRWGVTGAAPMTADLLRWFRAIGVPLSEIYGMSESSGPISWASRRIKAGTVGPAVPGTELALADDGEVITRGGNVFKGYLNNPEQTQDALSPDGWLRTGDIGVLDEDGYLRIVDRKKELIITAGGKNVSPANLEAALKGIPLVAQACAIGDNRPFVSALVVLDPEVAPVWAAQRGIERTDLASLAQNPIVVAEIERELVRVMEEFNNAEKVKKVTVLADEWLPDSDVLTPTSKLKRRGIHARYADEIDAIYA
jgi:long-chain acyl-CoA synthetase